MENILTQVRNELEQIKEGYVGIQVDNEVLFSITRHIHTGTVGSVWSLLNGPKSEFIGNLLVDIFDKDINLDLAIVTSSQESEDIMVDIISYYNYFDFVTIKEIYQSKIDPLFGLLVALRKGKRMKKTPFQLKADVILLFDGCSLINKENCISLFEGVVYKKPQVVSIVCLRTPDVPVSNYREQYPHSLTCAHVLTMDLPTNEADLFQELVYPEMSNMNKRYYNTLVRERLADWMSSKGHTMYEPFPSPFKMLPLKSPNPWNETSDQGSPTESEESIIESEESVVEGLLILERAWDKAYDELYRTIYGDD